MKGRLWRNIGVGAIAFGAGAIAFAESAGAQSQIVPDETLGAERSRVTPETIRGVESDRITGGASREANLFHSFTQFDIGEGRGAYFENPAGIQNIFSRITGNDISDINGTLGVLGSANLFLMNPNGIVFGQNARLDLGGSFVGTTANAIGFGAGGIFSASVPEVPGQVLNVNPSALLFNQMGNGAIASQAKELASASGQSLLFAGGDVSLDGSLLSSLGGRVELSGVAGIGTIPIISSGNALQLGFVSGGSLADIALQNNSLILTTAGGSIAINAQNLGLYDSSIFSALLAEQGGRSGDIVIDVTGSLSLDRSTIAQLGLENSQGDTGDLLINAQSIRLSDQSSIFNNSQRNAGSVRLNVAGEVALDANSLISSTSPPGSTGIGSDTFITAESINLTNRSIIGSISVGQGAAGQVSLIAQNAITLFDNSAIQSGVNPFLAGTTSRTTSGDIDIQARSLSLAGNSQISAISFDAGRSGDIRINTRESITLNSSFIVSDAVGTAEAGGDIQLQTDQLSLLNSSRISADTKNNFQTGNLGQGNAGNIMIAAQQLSLTSAGRISTNSNESRGNAGNINIQADDVEVTGFAGAEELEALGIPASDGLLLSQISSNVSNNDISDIKVQGGTITIDTDRLRLRNGGNITTDVQQARGQAGNIIVNAADLIEVSGRPRPNSPSGLSSSLQTDSIGSSGSIQVVTRQLNLTDGGEISAATFSQGDAGSVFIDAAEIVLRGLNTAITTQIDPGGQGRGGNLDIRTEQLRVRDNAQISTGTLGTGNAGNLRVHARTIELVDTPDPTDRFTGLFTLVNEGGIGNAGTLMVNTDRLILRNGGTISSEVFGQGQGGDLRIRARDRINVVGFVPVTTDDIYRSGIFTGTSGQGAAGNISIHSGNGITLRQQGRISSASLAGSRGNAGDINLQTGRLTILEGSSILASVASSRQNSQGVTLAGGQGRGGDVQITATNGIHISGSDRNGLSSIISTSTGRGATGRAGAIILTTDDLQINNGGIVAARTLNTSPAGNITINANDTVNLNNSRIETTAARSNGGDIQINAPSGTVVLENGDITTNSLRDGGDITIQGNILAFGDSDIITSSKDQVGGNITLGALFSDRPAQQSQLPNQGDGRVDLDAEGNLASGNITTPDTSFIQNSLADLPNSSINTDRLLANSCIVRDRQQGQFTITGSGGLPDRPGNPTTAYPTGTIQTVPVENTSDGDRPWQMGDPIVEPQGVYQLANGRLVISQECSQSHP